MKVLDLQCTRNHSFEGWFGSEGDFQSQLARGLVECPLCSDKAIHKLPSAPRLNFGGHAAQESGDSAIRNEAESSPSPGGLANVRQGGDLTPAAPASLSGARGPGQTEQGAVLKVLRALVQNTEDVGDKFAEEARRMHYGEQEHRNIRGQASAREALALQEEGIEVMPLPMQALFKETLQ